jgi:ribulose-5-phosphate 4-epimerase/fuculose-1-phosphate aldolase
MPSDRKPHRYPEFASVEDERRHRKQRLAASFRLFGQFGFDEGVAGHITARDPELLDHFWVNPFAMNFKQIRVKDLILVNHEGKVVEGTWEVNAAAFAIHSQIHAARPDVIAAAHAHSVYGKTWSTFRRRLDPLTQDACAFYNDHNVFDDYTGVVLDLEEGKRIAHALGDAKAAILSNHGTSPSERRPSTSARGGSSRWSARARRSCSPRRPARPC